MYNLAYIICHYISVYNYIVLLCFSRQRRKLDLLILAIEEEEEEENEDGSVPS